MSAQVPPGRVGPVPGGGAPVRGAVDLAALAQAREAQKQAEERAAQLAANPGAAAAATPLVFDATTENFQSEVIDRSFQVPVVIDLWATWCGPCKQLSPVLEELVSDDAGTWVLAKVDVDAQQAIAQAFQVQSVPTVVAIIKGQPVPLFQGAMPKEQLRQVIDELLKVAAENGVSGSVNAAVGETSEEPVEPQEDTRFDAAFDAFEAGDWDAAEKAYRDILATEPAEPDATAGLIRVELMRRTDGVDAAAAVAAADANPNDIEAAKRAADVELLNGNARAAFGRMIEVVRSTQGDDRQAAREHLVSLFELVGNQDPDVVAARTQLANALF